MLRTAFAGPCRVPQGARILIAVSGGADSTALLVGARRVAKEFGFLLRAAHLHHGLRGEEADRDQAFVRELCRGLGVPLATARWDTRARMRRRGLSGQDGLRRLRREFLRQAAKRSGASVIATGHHADDQLETLLARLVRGTGLRGLGAMSPRRGIWLKPLLGASRRDIETDLRRAGLSWREDPSNAEPRYLRSRIRHHAIPALLQAAGVGADRTGRARAALALRAVRAAREARQAARVIERMAASLLPPAPGTQLDVDVLARAPRPVRAAALGLAWRRLGTGAGLTARHSAALLGLARPAHPPGRVELPMGWLAVRERRSLAFRRAERTGQRKPLPSHVLRAARPR